MADPVRVAAAATVPTPAERPGWLEKILVLGVCGALLVIVNAADERGRRANETKAREVLAERSRHAAERASREAMTAPAAASGARTDGVGRESPIVIPSGVALGPATSVVTPQSARHRAEGPRPPGSETAIPEPVPAPVAAPARTPAPSPPALAAPAGGDDEPLLLLLMGALGLSMAGGGLRLVSRRSA